ncbi:SPOR domain-containing protein [uncultured Lacinutrix sp.]|uniref:SPOR domain-containing protein n=1 Tax=uncultured Lacinutrix sp. TaxID=574032 RepID=UPI0026116E48|nr:SPOR domain-containing protein [uncultured Lacinutrix sp.]
MKLTSFKNICLSAALTIGITTLSNAQEGNVVVYQDDDIPTLLELKKQINAEGIDSNNYKISIYSGSNTGAENAKNKYDLTYNSWSSKKVYETPNYKIYVGNFRTRLQADRALMEVKKKFPHAFIFEPNQTKKK